MEQLQLAVLLVSGLSDAVKPITVKTLHFEYSNVQSKYLLRVLMKWKGIWGLSLTRH